jgi:hypothetical protein
LVFDRLIRQLNLQHAPFWPPLIPSIFIGLFRI